MLIDSPVGAGSKHWFHLMRRSAGETVSGSIRLSFAWDVTARSLLNLKLAALERVLAQRTEVLCMLNPTHADKALSWARQDAQQNQLAQPDPKEKARAPCIFAVQSPHCCQAADNRSARLLRQILAFVMAAS